MVRKSLRREFSLAYDFNVPASQTAYTNLVGVKVPAARRWKIAAVEIRLASGSANKVKIDAVVNPNGDIVLPNNVRNSLISTYEASSNMDGYCGDAVTWKNKFTEEGAINLVDGEELVFRGKNSDSSAHKASANVTIIEEEVHDD